MDIGPKENDLLLENDVYSKIEFIISENNRKE